MVLMVVVTLVSWLPVIYVPASIMCVVVLFVYWLKPCFSRKRGGL